MAWTGGAWWRASGIVAAVPRSILAALLALLALAPSAPSSEPMHTLHLGVVSFYNPRLMYLKYQPLVDYLGERTGRRWELVISTSYQRTVDDLCAGRVDLAYIGPFAYLRAHELCGATPVVRLMTGGEATYRSFIMVRAESPARSLRELAGGRFGYGAALSTSSHLVPRAMLLEAGLQPGVDVACRYFGHHERAARAVLLGEVDACGIRDIVGERFVKRGLRVLARSRPIPNFPLVMGPQGGDELRRAVLHALVTAPSYDPAVAARIAAWDEELAAGFAPVEDEAYDPVRILARKVFGANALRVPERVLLCGGGS